VLSYPIISPLSIPAKPPIIRKKVRGGGRPLT